MDKLKQHLQEAWQRMEEGLDTVSWYVLKYNVDEENLINQKLSGKSAHKTDIQYQDSIVFKVPSVTPESKEKTLSRLRRLDDFSVKQALSKASNRARVKEQGQVDSWVEDNIKIGPNRIKVGGETVIFIPAVTSKISSQKAQKLISSGSSFEDLTKGEK